MNKKNLSKLAKRLDLKRVRWQAGNMVCSCPFAPWNHKGSDKRPSFGILISDDGESAFNCFGCGERGDLLRLVNELADLRGTDYSGVEEWVWRNEGVGDPRDLDDDLTDPQRRREHMREARDAEVYDDAEIADYLKNGPPAYAFTRGISEEACQVWEIGDNPADKRMTLPVRRARDKRLVGIKARSYSGERDKYIPYLPWSQSNFLYGEHLVTSERGDKVVLVEGEIDAIKVWMAGYNALAFMGQSVSPEQRRKLQLMDMNVILLPDRDEVGHRWAQQLGDKLANEVSVFDAKLPKSVKDAGEMNPDDLRELLESARLRV